MSLKKLPKEPPAHPDWIRLPKAGSSCPYCGLNRSALDKLVRAQEFNNFKPPVESRILKMKGTKRGIRLINYSSLCRYIESLPTDQEK